MSDDQGQKKQTVRINLPPKQTPTATVKVSGPPAKKAAAKAAPVASASAAKSAPASKSAPARRAAPRRQAAPAASGTDVALAVVTLALCAVTCVQLLLIYLSGTNS